VCENSKIQKFIVGILLRGCHIISDPTIRHSPHTPLTRTLTRTLTHSLTLTHTNGSTSVYASEGRSTVVVDIEETELWGHIGGVCVCMRVLMFSLSVSSSVCVCVCVCLFGVSMFSLSLSYSHSLSHFHYLSLSLSLSHAHTLTDQDDMGMGKTVQICAFLHQLFSQKLIKRVLVLSPTTVLPHWKRELHKWC